MYPHQAGIGHMVYDANVGPAYQGYLRKDVQTIAELLKDPGDSTYETAMFGKWHVGSEYPPDASDSWVQQTMGDETHPTPGQRGFDHFYGTLGGGGSYYQPPSLVLNDRVIAKDQLSKDYYYTDAINDEACNYIKSKSTGQDERPFFIYLSHVAPHWPLHAPQGVPVFRISTAEW